VQVVLLRTKLVEIIDSREQKSKFSQRLLLS